MTATTTTATEQLINEKVAAVREAYAEDPRPAPGGMRVSEIPNKAGKYDHLPKELLFHLNDVDYFIPKDPPPNVIFSYLRDARKNGAETAFANMFVELCGEDALDALADYDDMTTGEMKTLMKALQKKVTGALELGN